MLNTTRTNKNLVSYAEEKRVALKKALLSRPLSLKLLKAKEQLTSSKAIKVAATTGVFISYSNSDDVFALDLAENLRAHNIYAWLDIFEIVDDSDWNLEIERALQRYGLMIAILSPHAVRNQHLVDEWQNFEAVGKLILPVIYEQCQIQKPSFWLPSIDFSRNYDLGLKTLLRQLQ